MTNHTEHLGITSNEAKNFQEKYGKNLLILEKKQNFIFKILHVLSEPMFLLLIAAAVIYFILGEPSDGAIMLVFVAGIISIDVIQQHKTDKTLDALKNLSEPLINVIRDKVQTTIKSEDIVPGDVMLISEGIKIPADGVIIRANDLCIDESSLTGESEGVWKFEKGSEEAKTHDYWKKDYCYAGTWVTQGSATVLVDKIGTQTEYGKIGTDVAGAPQKPTPLQTQTKKLVKTSAIIAAILFLLVVGITFFNLSSNILKDRIVESILSGITLAMAMIPEEFPVILTVFLSLGAWRLAKKNSIIRKLPSVETLGAVSVLCVDKTGTITKNKMTVADVWIPNNNTNHFCEIMGMACESETYDPMEKAMLEYCESFNINKEHLFSGKLVKEYPFTNKQKMMGHVWERQQDIIITSKGSVESILPLCQISSEQRAAAQEKINSMSNNTLRVIAVAKMKVSNINDVPLSLNKCNLTLVGIVGLFDPPRDTVKNDIENCIKAGMRVVMITGDNGATASAIAKQVGILNADNIITGDQLNQMNDDELKDKVKYTNVFSRVIPEHKMRIVKAFKENGEIVAMTGDGVNDAPALKYADIGIAMGKRGSDVSKEAADLILLDDNFSTIVDTVADGRRIYDNIRKAVGYVFTIHIPIALVSLMAPLMKISPASLLLLPLHVVLLELVIDPTCSIVLERQPPEQDIMLRKPRNPKQHMISKGMLLKSIIQGIAIFAGTFITYFVVLSNNPQNAPLARTMGFSIILLSNILLVLVNSSDAQNFIKSFKNLIKDKVVCMINIITILLLLVFVYSPLNVYLKFAPPTFIQMVITILISCVCVLWYEVVKIFRCYKIKK